MAERWIDPWLQSFAAVLGTDTLILNPVIALLLLSMSCGLVGSTVVGTRMAFFSDAMAHTAFAGIAFAVLSMILVAGVRSTRDADELLWIVQPVMIVVGILSGVSIVFVRERTGLTTDTVIGVFFALAIGLGSMVLPTVRSQVNLNPEEFLYGSVTLVSGGEIAQLAALLVITAGMMAWLYNSLALTSFNPTLAQSRGIPVRRNHYLFVILLALVVNVAIRSVGVLLINALLIVPAATAANLSRNVRQVFWWTLAVTLFSALVGLELSRRVSIPLGNSREMVLAPSGTIVVVSVACFAGSFLITRLVRRQA